MRVKEALHRVGALAPVLTFLALALFFSVFSDSFLTGPNVLNILRQTSPLAIMAVGITFVLLCAEIDLSIAYMATLSGVLGAYAFRYLAAGATGAPGILTQVLPILIALLASGALGYANGVGTARVGLPSFMMTLAMMLLTQGLALRITQGEPVFEIPPVLASLANDSVAGIPNVTVVALAFLAAGFVVLRYTRFGRYVYMVGGNRRAAELAGVNVAAVTTACLCISGLTAGFSGLILVGRMGSAQASGLDALLIDCISAVVLGGTSLFGGKGGIPNTVIGLLTFGVLHNGIHHIEMNIYLEQFVSGIILLAALVLNVTMARIRAPR